MSANFTTGVMTSASWHRQESIEEMPDAEAMIAAGYRSGAWPVKIDLEPLQTAEGLLYPGHGVVATYQDGRRQVHAAVSKRYQHLPPEEWKATVEAAIKAGAKPSGAFSLSHGGKILATFDIGRTGSGNVAIDQTLNMVDSLDQTSSFAVGSSSIRVVCCNTLAAWLSADGKGAARIRHTGTIAERAAVLRGAIEANLSAGQTIASLYRDATEARLAKPDLEELIAKLYPAPAEDGRKRTRALNAQKALATAMLRPENNEGPTVATVWNGATWLVDRTLDDNGDVQPRKGRGTSDPRESMLFGSRGARVEKIRQIMVTILRPDGSEEDVPAHEAVARGVDPAQVGRALLSDMLEAN